MLAAPPSADLFERALPDACLPLTRSQISTGKSLANLSLHGSGSKSLPRERCGRRRSSSGDSKLEGSAASRLAHGQGASSCQCTAEHSAGTALLGLFPEVLIMVRVGMEFAG